MSILTPSLVALLPAPCSGCLRGNPTGRIVVAATWGAYCSLACEMAILCSASNIRIDLLLL